LLMGKNNNFEIAIFPFIPSLDVLVWNTYFYINF
jgi:hypothetical protein